MIWGKTWIGHLQWMAWDLFSVYHAHIQMDCFYNCQWIDWNEGHSSPSYAPILWRSDFDLPWYLRRLWVSQSNLASTWKALSQILGLTSQKKSALKEVVYMQPDSVTQWHAPVSTSRPQWTPSPYPSPSPCYNHRIQLVNVNWPLNYQPHFIIRTVPNPDNSIRHLRIPSTRLTTSLGHFTLRG